MFDEIDRAYYARRAAETRERAERILDPSIRKVHLEIAAEYQRRLEMLPRACSFNS